MKFIKAILLMALVVSSIDMQASTVAKAMADRGQSNWSKSPILPALAVAFTGAGIYAALTHPPYKNAAGRIKRDFGRYVHIHNYTNYLANTPDTELHRQERQLYEVPARSAMGGQNEIMKALAKKAKELESEPRASLIPNPFNSQTLGYQIANVITPNRRRPAAATVDATLPDVIGTARGMVDDYRDNRFPQIRALDKKSKQLKILGWASAGAAVVSLCCWGLASKK